MFCRRNDINLIFDFDGTLVDSFHSVIEKFNHLSDKFNFRKVDALEIDSLRDFTSRELIKYLKIPIYKLPSIILKIRKQMRSEMQMLLPFANLTEVLQEIYSMKVNLGILTSNSSENVRDWLNRNKLLHLFNFIHAESSYFGKKRILQKIIASNSIDRSKAFYIGDETRDIEAAKECNLSSIAVTWGFNSEKILSQHQPDYIVRKPEDILEILK